MSVFDHFDPSVFERVARFARWLGGWFFRYEMHGLEEFPQGPCLVVGNHSGLGFVEEALMIGAWHAEHGTDRRAWGLIHDFFFHAPPFSRYYRAVGAIPASPENARAALERGDVVLVFPGGDLDCCRPFYEPRTVHFGDRRGYVRLALETGVPIVPLATTGSHWTWTFLPGGRALAKIPSVRNLFRSDRLPIPTAAVAALIVAAFVVTTGLSAWWLVATCVIGLLPTPVRIRSEVGTPIDARKLAASGSGDAVSHVHGIVYGRLQASVRSAPGPVGTDSDWEGGTPPHRQQSARPTGPSINASGSETA